MSTTRQAEIRARPKIPRESDEVVSAREKRDVGYREIGDRASERGLGSDLATL